MFLHLNKTRSYLIAAGLALVAVFLAALRFNDVLVGTFVDDAHYIILAKSIISWQGYRLINYPVPPVEPAFPPGWPLLLAPFVGLFPFNFTIFKLVTLGFWLGSLGLAHLLFAGRLPPAGQLALPVLLVVNPHLVGMSTLVFSEAAFLFFMLLTFYLFDRWELAKENQSGWLLALAIFLALFATLIRSVGFTLLIALLGYLLLSRQWRYAGWAGGGLAVAAVPVVVWFSWRQGGDLLFSPTYSEHFASVGSQMVHYLQFWNHWPALSFEDMADALAPLFSLKWMVGLFGPAAVRTGSVLLLAVVAAGYAVAWRRPRPQEIFVGLYLGIFYLWTVYIGRVQQRQLLPLLPFLYYYAIRVFLWADTLAMRRFRLRRGLLPATALALLVAVSLARNVHEWQRPAGQRLINVSSGAAWLHQNAPANAVVMATNPEPAYLYTRRLTQPFPAGIEEIEPYLQNYSIGYILIQPHLIYWDAQKTRLDDFTVTKLLPYLASHPERFRRVYDDPAQNISVYQVGVGP